MESSDPNDPHQTVEMTEFRCIDQNKTKHFKKYLKFTSENNEKRYRFMSISSEKDNFKVSENLLDRLKQFLLGYYALSLVYFSLYIVSYALDESSSDSLKFQLVLILVQGILNSFIYYYAFKTNLFNQARLEVLSLAYILAGISLILNNGPIQTLILDEKSETYISCLPGFLVLLTISPFVTHQTFLNYTFANSLIASIYLVLHCISDQKLSVTLFEFAIYVSRIIFEIFKFYKTEKDLRLRFLRKSQFNEIITITTRADPQNDLECINENLSECLLTLKAVKKSPNTIESRMTRMQELIKKVIGILKGNTNIYTTNIEAITKYMSEEDKLFIKQT